MKAGAETEFEVNYNVLYRHLPIDPSRIKDRRVSIITSLTAIPYYRMLMVQTSGENLSESVNFARVDQSWKTRKHDTGPYGRGG